MKFIKTGFYVLSGILLLLVLAAGIFLATFDGNQYRPLISEQVEKYTGRRFSLGEIRPSVFPWLGVALQQVRLANPPGFSQAEMLQLEQLDVRLKLLPLLRRQLEIDTVHLHGLQLNLEKNRQGVSNWQDLLDKQASAEKPSAEKKSHEKPREKSAQKRTDSDQPPLALRVNGIEIEKAQIRWTDAEKGQKIQLQDFNLQTGKIQPGRPLPLKLSSHLSLNEPAAEIDLSLQSRIEFDPQTRQLELDKLILSTQVQMPQAGIEQLDIELDSPLQARLEQQVFKLPEVRIRLKGQGKALPTGKIDASVAGAIKIDLQRARAEIDRLRVKALGLNIDSPLVATNILQAPRLNGRFSVQAFNPAALARKLAIDLPTMQGKQALQNMAINFEFDASEKSAQLNAIEIKLDQSRLTGQLSLSNYSQPAIRYQLQLDNINLDQYLPGASKPATASVGTGAPRAADEDIAIELPLPLLRSLDIAGNFRVNSLQAYGQSLSKLEIETRARGGLIQLPAVNVKLLGGSLRSSLRLDARSDIPRYRITLDARNLQADSVVTPLLQKILAEQAVAMSGAARVELDINARGNSLNKLIAATNGQFKLNISRAELKGVDTEYFVRQAVIDYMRGKNMTPPAEWKKAYKPRQTTALKMARASATIRNGIIENRDLRLESVRFMITGQGEIMLPQQQLDYRLTLDINPASKKTLAERLLDIPLPVKIRGAFKAPDISIDMQRWKTRVSRELKAEARHKAKQKIQQEEKKVIKKARQKLKDRLNRLFK